MHFSVRFITLFLRVPTQLYIVYIEVESIREIHDLNQAEQ